MAAHKTNSRRGKIRCIRGIRVLHLFQAGVAGKLGTNLKHECDE
jgi:hypothetical protein